MISITKTHRAEIGHRLMEYDGKCAHLHGHSYLFEVTATAPQLDRRGMVADFADVKAAMREVIDPWDHSLILRWDDPLARLTFTATNGEDGRVHIWRANPTAEEMAFTVASRVQLLLPAQISVSHVRVWETATSHADWSSR